MSQTELYIILTEESKSFLISSFYPIAKHTFVFFIKDKTLLLTYHIMKARNRGTLIVRWKHGKNIQKHT